jgi:hypothetical protein
VTCFRALFYFRRPPVKNLNTTTSKHKHKWIKITESKKDERIVKVSECNDCKALKIETSQIINNQFLEQLGIRETKLIPVGEYDDDRLVLMAFDEYYDQLHSTLSGTLRGITDTYKKLLANADKVVPKTVMQIVADRMDKLGFGYNDPVYYDVPYVISIDYSGFEDSLQEFMHSMQYAATRLRLRELWNKFQIRNSTLLNTLNKDYDAKGRKTALLYDAIEMIIRIEIKETGQAMIPLETITSKITKQLDLLPEECPIIIQQGIEWSHTIILKDDKITTSDAAEVLNNEVSTDGQRDPNRLHFRRPLNSL